MSFVLDQFSLIVSFAVVLENVLRLQCHEVIYELTMDVSTETR